MTITFSIIIPTYNRKLKLLRALESVLNQTFNNFEIIVYDDGSTDGTKEEIQKMTSPQIRYFWKENSGLPAVGRNFGIQEAKGEWLCFLDSDDYWELSKLEKINKAIQNNPQYQIFSHDEFQVNAKGEILEKLIHTKNTNLSYFKHLLLVENCLSPSAITIKKDLMLQFTGYDINSLFFSVEDFELWLRLTKNHEVFHVDEALGFYLVDGAGISSSLDRHLDCLKNVYTKHVGDLPLELQSKSWASYHYIKARAYHRNTELSKAIKSYIEVLKLNLFFLKAWIGLGLAIVKIKT